MPIPFLPVSSHSISDEKGELLINVKPTDKPEVKILTGRLMSIKEKIKTLCGLDPFFQGVLVFPSARVVARWGTTKAIHCIRDEQLYDYIVESKKPKKLSRSLKTLFYKSLTPRSIDHADCGERRSSIAP